MDRLSDYEDLSEHGNSDSDTEFNPKQKISNYGGDSSDVSDDDNLEDDLEIEDEDIGISSDDERSVVDKNCLYNYAEDVSDTEVENLDDLFDEDDEQNQAYVGDSERITKPFLTKYERVRLIGDRTKQLAGGAKPMIKGAEHLSSKDIAILELEHNVLPLIIERPLPNGIKEKWKISELKH